MIKLKNILFISSALILGSCAYFVENSIQDVQFLTPGAQGTKCDIYVDQLRYRVNPPETINLPNGYKDLVVDCKAPGNRHKKIYIEPKLADSSLYNLGTLGTGYFWDHASKALYKYPQVIEINFTDAPVTAMPLPAQNNPDIRQPEEYPLEEYRASSPQLNSDRYKEEPEILRRGQSSSSADTYSETEDAFFEPAGSPSGKGSFNNMIESLNPADSGPTPIIPGE